MDRRWLSAAAIGPLLLAACAARAETVIGDARTTPVATATHLYCVNEAGLLQVVDTRGKEGEITGTLNLDDTILGSPAVGGGAIYLRSNTKIYKISE